MNNLVEATWVNGTIMVDPNDPTVVKGVNGKYVKFGNKTRAQDARLHVEQLLARGGTVTQVPAGAAGGVKRPRGPRQGNGRTAAPLIDTGDKKFDMYLNALPGPLRAIVVPQGLDPRALYKEYRALGKAGLLEKYAEQIAKGE